MSVTASGEKAAPIRGTANAWGNEQEPSQAGLVGRVCNTRQSPLSIIGQAGILGARVRKDACLPREICHVALERRVRGKLAEGSSNPTLIAWQKSAEGILGGSAPNLGMNPHGRTRNPPDISKESVSETLDLTGWNPIVMTTPEGPNGPQPNGLGKWSWVSKSVSYRHHAAVAEMSIASRFWPRQDRVRLICACSDQPNRRIRDPYVRWCGRDAL